jgi:hypothetical protein
MIVTCEFCGERSDWGVPRVDEECVCLRETQSRKATCAGAATCLFVCTCTFMYEKRESLFLFDNVNVQKK